LPEIMETRLGRHQPPLPVIRDRTCALLKHFVTYICSADSDKSP
jgi:hypothetical protein